MNNLFIPNTQALIKSKMFTPRALGSNLKLWLDGTDTGTITKDGSNKISVWLDKSGNGYHAVQATSTAQPTWVSNSLNALPVIRFNGSSTFLDSSINIDYTVLPNIYMFWVYKKNSSSPANQTLFGQDDGNWDRFVLLGHSVLGASISDGSTAVAVTQLGTVGSWRLLTITYKNSVGSGSDVSFNNVSVKTITEAHTNSGLSYMRIAEVGNGTIFGAMDIAEIVITTTDITATEKNELTYYLNRKYGLF